MKVSETRSADPKFSAATAGESARGPEQTESRALVPVAPADEARPEPSGHYREASFLAQLIATKEQMPQTRERRRAEPGEAIAAYRAANTLVSH